MGPPFEWHYAGEPIVARIYMSSWNVLSDIQTDGETDLTCLHIFLT